MAHFEKQLMVKEVREKLKDSSGVILSNFQRLSVVEMDELRRNLEKGSSRFIVSKNSLLKRALAEVGMEQAGEYLDGKTGLAVYQGDPVTVAKTLIDFSKEHENFRVRGGFVEGEFVPEGRTRALSELPSRDALYAMVVRGMAAPLSGLVNVLSGSIRGLVTAIDQIRKQKEEQVDKEGKNG